MQKIRNEVLCPNISHTNHLGPSKLSNVFDLLSTHSSPAILIHGAVFLLTIIIGIVENRSIVGRVYRDRFLKIDRYFTNIIAYIKVYSNILNRILLRNNKNRIFFYFHSLRNLFFFFFIFFSIVLCKIA